MPHQHGSKIPLNPLHLCSVFKVVMRREGRRFRSGDEGWSEVGNRLRSGDDEEGEKRIQDGERKIPSLWYGGEVVMKRGKSSEW